MKALFRYHSEALAAAAKLCENYTASTCDAWDDVDEIKDAQLQAAGVSGEVNCYRTEGGDILAWWEEDE